MSQNLASFVASREGQTWGNVLIGAVVGLVVSSMAPILAQFAGGATAGYLQRGTGRSVALVGAAAGLLSALPGLLFAALVVVPFFLMPTLSGAPSGDFLFVSGASLALLAFVGVTAFVVSVMVGGLGGVLGAIVAEG